MGEVRQGTIPESLPQEHRNYFNLKTCPPAFQFNKQLPLAGTMQRSLGLNDLFMCKDGGKKVEGGPRRSCVLQFSLSRQHLPFPREMGERIGKIKVQELLGRDNNTLLDKAFVSKAKQGIHLQLLISRKAGLIMCNSTLGKQVLSCLPSPPSSFFTLVFITEHIWCCTTWDIPLACLSQPFWLHPLSSCSPPSCLHMLIAKRDSQGHTGKKMVFHQVTLSLYNY